MGAGEVLGILGLLKWLRCRSCGVQWSRKIRNRLDNVWK